MTRKMTCIQCPKSCSLAVDIEDGRVVHVNGNLCPKGEEYAKEEIENPSRILTATVLAQGLSLRMIPVRTDKPVPKARMREAASEIRKIRVTRAMKAGDVLVGDFCGLGLDLIVTRTTRILENNEVGP
jgi:CxxC motif-containing protein